MHISSLSEQELQELNSLVSRLKEEQIENEKKAKIAKLIEETTPHIVKIPEKPQNLKKVNDLIIAFLRKDFQNTSPHRDFYFKHDDIFMKCFVYREIWLTKKQSAWLLNLIYKEYEIRNSCGLDIELTCDLAVSINFKKSGLLTIEPITTTIIKPV